MKEEGEREAGGGGDMGWEGGKMRGGKEGKGGRLGEGDLGREERKGMRESWRRCKTTRL